MVVRDNDNMIGAVTTRQGEARHSFDCMTFDGISAVVRISVFTPAASNGACECHLMVQATDAAATFGSQLADVERAFGLACRDCLPGDCRPVFKRYFLSDAANQAGTIDTSGPVAVSVIGQPPLNGTKVALWCYLVSGVEMTQRGESIVGFTHGGHDHLWMAGASAPGMGSLVATRAMLGDYARALRQMGGSLLDNCVRTWFFVRDVDVNYAGVVTGRNDVFAVEGLTPSTHSISSTGIGGCDADASVTVKLDVYAETGLLPGQMGYLYATSHLNPTYEYGVSFERGTTVDYGDRRRFFISGTASIDNRGEILWPGDIRRQTARMLENVGALLAEAGASWADVSQMIVYLRDAADYAVVESIFAGRFPLMPRVIVLAPVCRPGWLIEMECMGVADRSDSRYAPF
ncbi:MAG: Rid family hydrolase [Pseudoflavonifractor sp.]|nr:Rid family hydrolase [Pseudoflavonifractor sp.]